MLLHPALLQPAVAMVDKSEQCRLMLAEAFATSGRSPWVGPLTGLCASMVEDSMIDRDGQRCLAALQQCFRASRSKRSFNSPGVALGPTNRTSSGLGPALRRVSVWKSTALGWIAQFTVLLKLRDVRSQGI